MEFIKGVFLIWLIFIVYKWITSNIRSTRKLEEMLKEKAEAEREMQDEAIRAEIELTESAYAALPDIDTVMTILLDRYGWREILETIGIFPIHFELLRKVSLCQPLEIKLPNMQSNRYGRDEIHIIAKAREVSMSRDPLFGYSNFHEDVLGYGIDSLAQEPTVLTLKELASYIDTSKPIYNESRDFECVLTPRGEALIQLYCKYFREDITKPYLRRAPNCSEVRSKISNILYRVLFLIESPVKRTANQ
jgi:hypothetical protein